MGNLRRAKVMRCWHRAVREQGGDAHKICTVDLLCPKHFEVLKVAEQSFCCRRGHGINAGSKRKGNKVLDLFYGNIGDRMHLLLGN